MKKCWNCIRKVLNKPIIRFIITLCLIGLFLYNGFFTAGPGWIKVIQGMVITSLMFQAIDIYFDEIENKGY